MAATAQHLDSTSSLVDRGALTIFLGDMADEAGAAYYMLLTTVSHERKLAGRVISSNWVFDAIQLVGLATLGDIARSDIVLVPGGRPRSLDTNAAPSAGAAVDAQSIALLRRLGHAEIYCLRLNIGRAQAYLMLSGDAGAINADKLGEIQMRSNYRLSGMSEDLRLATLRNGLQVRERECLAWAAEGKTSEEIAMILGLPASTANAAITIAMEKLQARNRVEAVATAIRTGIL